MKNSFPFFPFLVVCILKFDVLSFPKHPCRQVRTDVWEKESSVRIGWQLPRAASRKGWMPCTQEKAKGEPFLFCQKQVDDTPNYVSIPRGEGCRGGDKECQRQMGSHF